MVKMLGEEIVKIGFKIYKNLLTDKVYRFDHWEFVGGREYFVGYEV